MITNKIAIQNYLLTTIDSAFDDQIEEWIEAVEEYMNGETRRQLIADDDESSWKYDGVGKCDLMIDDFYTISEVRKFSSIDDATGEEITDGTHLYPANTTPKWRIDSTTILPKGKQNIQITGRRGCYPSDAIPADLKTAATILVAGIVNYSNQSEGEVRSETIGRWTVTYDTTRQSNDYDRAIATLQHYKRIR